MTQAYQLGTKQQVSFWRLTQVSSLDFRTQFIYLMNIRLPNMNENECQHIRILAFSLNATTEDQVIFKKTIDKMTSLRLEHLQEYKKNPQYEFERRQTFLQTKKVENNQPSLASKIFGCLKCFISSSPILATIQSESPNQPTITMTQEEEDIFLQNSSSEPSRKSK